MLIMKFNLFFITEKIVEPIQSKERPAYYHRKFRRVPNIDQCDVNDAVCMYEAEEQFKRDKLVCFLSWLNFEHV